MKYYIIPEEAIEKYLAALKQNKADNEIEEAVFSGAVSAIKAVKECETIDSSKFEEMAITSADSGILGKEGNNYKRGFLAALKQITEISNQ